MALRSGPQPPFLDLPTWFLQSRGGEIRALNWHREPVRTFTVMLFDGTTRTITLVAERYGTTPNGKRDGRKRTGLIVKPHPRDRDWLFSFEREHLVA